MNYIIIIIGDYMKVKIKFTIKKEYILYFSLFFILLVAILSINTYFKSTKEISLAYPDDLYSELNIYEDQMKNYKNSNCKKFVQSFIDEIQVGILNGEYSPQTIYIFGKNVDILNDFKNGNEMCNINKDNQKNIADLYLSILSNDYIYPYLFQYELSFSTNSLKDNLNYTQLSYQSLKRNEMSLLRIYMDKLREENNYE